MMSQSQQFPPPPGASDPVLWSGGAFEVGERRKPVLAYALGSESGWNDDLTSFHENLAGKDHYIDRASRANAVRCLKKFTPGTPPTIIDIGCSSGFMLRDLRAAMPAANLIGSDYIAGPLDALAAEMPDVPFIQFDLMDCPLPDRFVDGICLLNVLEHVPDDERAVKHLYRILRPGGVVAIEVPSGPDLYDVYDKQLMHFRRYRMADLEKMVRAAGFEAAEKSHLGFFLYPAFRFVKKRNQKFLDAPADVQRAIVAKNIQASQRNPLMDALMQVEAAMRGALYYPVGIRCLLVARRPLGS
jgi:SAM-dependent methyltransferase